MKCKRNGQMLLLCFLIFLFAFSNILSFVPHKDPYYRNIETKSIITQPVSNTGVITANIHDSRGKPYRNPAQKIAVALLLFLLIVIVTQRYILPRVVRKDFRRLFKMVLGVYFHGSKYKSVPIYL